MKPTIKTIAKAAGVSTATVSKALNDMPDISEATKERIRKICQEMGYTLNANARSLASGSTHTIGLMVSDIAAPFTGIFGRSVVTRMTQHGYNVYVFDTESDPEKEERALVRLLENRVDALIVQAGSASLSRLLETVRHRVPVISVGRVEEAAEAVVLVDEVEGGQMTARHLYLHGHRSCVIFSSSEKSEACLRRIQGFDNYVRAHGGEVKMLRTEARGEEAGRKLAEMLVRSNLQASAIFALDDTIAFGALHQLRLMGKRVPEDYSLVGYGDTPCASLGMISLTTLQPPNMEMGLCASDVAVDIIVGNTESLRYFSLAPVLIERATVRKC